MHMFAAAGVIAAGAAMWSLYFRFKDRLNPEPVKLLVMSVVLGGVAAAGALMIFRLLTAIGVPEMPQGSGPGLLVYCIAVIGAVEEGAKFAVVRSVMARWREFDEPIDGMVYAAMVAIGFAGVENLLYAQAIGWPEQLARARASPLTHALFAAVWGLGLARALLVSRTALGRFLWQAGPLAAGAGLHGLYDYFILALDATWASSAVILLLWIGLIVCGRRFARQPLPVRKEKPPP
jgi:RsiW-degrading membrane proteinase PrsW (M82 family)